MFLKKRGLFCTRVSGFGDKRLLNHYPKISRYIIDNDGYGPLLNKCNCLKLKYLCNYVIRIYIYIV